MLSELSFGRCWPPRDVICWRLVARAVARAVLPAVSTRDGKVVMSLLFKGLPPPTPPPTFPSTTQSNTCLRAVKNLQGKALARVGWNVVTRCSTCLWLISSAVAKTLVKSPHHHRVMVGRGLSCKTISLYPPTNKLQVSGSGKRTSVLAFPIRCASL